ncbi:MAG: hypothetical protein CMK71_02730 [Pseudomonadaceae bacterium]|nr:hypothetical protein [Pseudomonadaceae bacterium]
MTDMKAKQVWVVYQNTDLPEGRGRELPIAVCESQSTALRLAKNKGVMGSNASVIERQAIFQCGEWLAPVQIIEPSDKEVEADRRMADFNAVIEKAKALGLTIEDLKTLSRDAP